MNTFRLAARWSAALGCATLSCSVVLAQARPAGAPAGGAAPPAAPQSAPPSTAAPRSTVAVLDLARVFKEYGKYQVQRDQLTADLVAADEGAKVKAEQMRAKGEQLKQFNKGTPEFNKLESEITNMQADLQVQVQLQKRDFVQREAKLMHATLMDVKKEVQYAAERFGVTLVLRSITEQADPSAPEQVLGQLEYPIIWASQQIDLTQVVIDQLNRNNPAQRTGQLPPRPAGAPPVNR